MIWLILTAITIAAIVGFLTGWAVSQDAIEDMRRERDEAFGVRSEPSSEQSAASSTPAASNPQGTNGPNRANEAPPADKQAPPGVPGHLADSEPLTGL